MPYVNPEDMIAYQRQYRQKHRKKRLAYMKAWRSHHPRTTYCRQYWRLKKYKVSPQDVERQLKAQNYTCAVCPRHIVEQSCRVDHDHRTGKFRALLCSWCNRGLGFFGDSPIQLHAAAAYLERYK